MYMQSNTVCRYRRPMQLVTAYVSDRVSDRVKCQTVSQGVCCSCRVLCVTGMTICHCYVSDVVLDRVSDSCHKVSESVIRCLLQLQL